MWRSESWDLVGGCWLTGHFALRIILVLLGPISGLLSYYMISFSHMLMMSFTMLWHSQASPLQKNCHYFQNGKLNEPLLLCQSLVFHYKAEDKLIHDPTSHEKNRGCCLSLRDSKNKNVLAPRTLPLSLSLFTFLQKTPSSQWWSFCLKARDVESHPTVLTSTKGLHWQFRALWRLSVQTQCAHMLTWTCGHTTHPQY